MGPLPDDHFGFIVIGDFEDAEPTVERLVDLSELLFGLGFLMLTGSNAGYRSVEEKRGLAMVTDLETHFALVGCRNSWCVRVFESLLYVSMVLSGIDGKEISILLSREDAGYIDNQRTTTPS